MKGVGRKSVETEKVLGRSYPSHPPHMEGLRNLPCGKTGRRWTAAHTGTQRGPERNGAKKGWKREKKILIHARLHSPVVLGPRRKEEPMAFKKPNVGKTDNQTTNKNRGDGERGKGSLFRRKRER